MNRPEQVKLCYDAVCNGDLNSVKKQVKCLLEQPGMPSTSVEKPQATWLYHSLSRAIQKKDVEIVKFLLDSGVAGNDLPGEVAVRARAYEVLELFFEYGWDINKPICMTEPPVLGYYALAQTKNARLRSIVSLCRPQTTKWQCGSSSMVPTLTGAVNGT